MAPARYLDGTNRHPASASAVKKSAHEVGFAAAEGERVKAKRYPPCNGKKVIACSIETWGSIGDPMDALLRDFFFVLLCCALSTMTASPGIAATYPHPCINASDS